MKNQKILRFEDHGVALWNYEKMRMEGAKLSNWVANNCDGKGYFFYVITDQ